MQAQSAALRVFILGSCVSRDAFEFTASPAVEVVGYIARTSLATAFHAEALSTIAGSLDRIESAFQRRMVAHDVNKSTASSIAQSGADCVLLDLIDERFSVARISTAYATYSGEFQKLRLPSGAIGALLDRHSPERQCLWEDGVSKLAKIVDRNRVVVNRVFWATHDTAGNQLADHWQVASHNTHLERMYEFLLSEGFDRWITYPRGSFLADSHHKWGLAPFHYTRNFYEATIAGLLQCAAHLGSVK